MMEELKLEYTKIADKLQEIEERNKIQKKVQKIDNITDVSLNFDDELKEFNEKCKRDADIEAEKQLKELRKMFKKF
jgi:actin-related protein